jgi:hypothetical protein
MTKEQFSHFLTKGYRYWPCRPLVLLTALASIFIPVLLNTSCSNGKYDAYKTCVDENLEKDGVTYIEIRPLVVYKSYHERFQIWENIEGCRWIQLPNGFLVHSPKCKSPECPYKDNTGDTIPNYDYKDLAIGDTDLGV